MDEGNEARLTTDSRVIARIESARDQAFRSKS